MKVRRARYPSEVAPKFIVRMPAALRDQIRRAAQKNYRSMTKEIVARLDRTFAQEQEQGGKKV